MSYSDMHWSIGRLEVRFSDTAGVIGIASVLLDGREICAANQPLPCAEVGVVGAGRAWSARRFIDSEVGRRAAVESITATPTPHGEELAVRSHDPESGIRTTTTFTATEEGRSLRIATTVTNTGGTVVELSWVASAVLNGVLGHRAADITRLWSADNDWLAEYRWASTPVRSVLPDLNRWVHEHDPRGVHSRTAHGTWPTDGSLPIGILEDTASGLAVGWEIVHNGGWHWQVGERGDDLFVSLLGPTETHHEWGVTLAPGQEFTTVPVVVAFSDRGAPGVFESLTASRRGDRRSSDDLVELPVVFNDYMNTLMGDPTTEKLLPLVDAAADAGTEIFCIDAGWYDDTADGWWDSVGAWEPAASRFPRGLREVIDRITARGMRAGLWLEPEVVGVKSPLADDLPDEAFFLRRGRRVVEHGRFHLDLRHPLARKHLDEVVDRLVVDVGASYFKLDYNINPGNGTDGGGLPAGTGLLGHNRAYLAWLDGVLDRHPGLTIENCASGGMRVDQATLSRLQLQSTSDQQDPLRYPPIAAAAPTAMTPEQALSWAYPQPEHSDDLVAFTLAAGILGRFQLSGHLDRMSAGQLDLVQGAVDVHKAIRADIPRSVAFWPLGLPAWEDEWVALGLRTAEVSHLVAWRRSGASDTVPLPVPHVVPGSTAKVAFPTTADAVVELTTDDGTPTLTVTLPRAPQAVVVTITAPDPERQTQAAT